MEEPKGSKFYNVSISYRTIIVDRLESNPIMSLEEHPMFRFLNGRGGGGRNREFPQGRLARRLRCGLSVCHLSVTKTDSRESAECNLVSRSELDRHRWRSRHTRPAPGVRTRALLLCGGRACVESLCR